MTRSYRLLSTSTALALALGVSPAISQTYEQLSGIMLPTCSGEGDPVDAGSLTEESFGAEQPVPPLLVDAANQRGEICVNAEGEVELSGESARQAGIAEAAPAAEPAPNPSAADPEAPAGSFAEAAANAEADADTPADPETVADEDAEAPADAPADPETAAAETAEPAEPAGDGVADAPAESEAPATIGEIAQDLQNQQSGDAAAENPDGPETVEAPAADPEPEPEPAPPVAAAAETDDGREAEPAEVSETVVTEENSRSSSEEFASAEQNATASGGESSGGLSNLEKFALGAAGIVALDAIIGRNSEVVSNTGDRVVVRRSDGDLEVLRDDDTLLRRPGSEVRTETFSDGSTRTTVIRPNGARIVTIADASGRVVKRTRYTAGGREVVIIDDTQEDVQPVDVSRLPPPAEREVVAAGDRSALEAALQAEARSRVDRRFSLRQVREYRQVRDLMPEINIDAINFATGSAAIPPDEAEELFELGEAMRDFIADNPDELFLVEGHTDAVGDPVYNLALSDRRAESVALALAEYFDVPPENMIIQGYGESELLVPTTEAERANRRAVVRRVTPLLR